MIREQGLVPRSLRETEWTNTSHALQAKPDRRMRWSMHVHSRCHLISQGRSSAVAYDNNTLDMQYTMSDSQCTNLFVFANHIWPFMIIRKTTDASYLNIDKGREL
jgi:hypothetical protein